MDLTDSEREEFTRLADATLDPGVWDEEDYPILKATSAEYEREQARECRDDLSVEQPSVAEDDEADGGEFSCPE
jgi:hypothetical protein